MNELNFYVYIGCKIIKATPATYGEFRARTGRSLRDIKPDAPGYEVHYADGYVSWSPKDVFETAYRPITQDELKMLS